MICTYGFCVENNKKGNGHVGGVSKRGIAATVPPTTVGRSAASVLQ